MRIAIKDAETNIRVLKVLSRALDADQPPARAPWRATPRRPKRPPTG